MIRCALLLAIASSVAPQDDAERNHDASQRPIRLQLLDVDFKETPLEEVLDSLEKRGFKVSRWDWRSGWVTYSAKGVTLRELLDVIEDQVDLHISLWGDRISVSHNKGRRNPRGYVPGVTFELERRIVRSITEVRGVALYVSSLGPAVPKDIEVTVFDGDNLEVPVERCEQCGPLLAFVKGDPGTLRVQVKGQVQWQSIYTLKVADPATPQDFRVGDFAIRYDFPEVTITSERERPFDEFPTAELVGVFKDQRKAPGQMGPRPVCGTMDRKGWCACLKSGSSLKRQKPAKRSSSKGRLPFMQVRSSDLSSMTILFHKPVKEPFEVELESLKTPKGSPPIHVR